ncbi:hypothetical protein ACI2KR_31150 [Pseudomonas luteola]
MARLVQITPLEKQENGRVMDYEELSSLPQNLANNQEISVSELRNQADRTLILGTTESLGWRHIYLKDGFFHVLTLDRWSQGVRHTQGETLPIKSLRLGDTSVVQGPSCYQFCTLLNNKSVFLTIADMPFRPTKGIYQFLTHEDVALLTPEQLKLHDAVRVIDKHFQESEASLCKRQAQQKTHRLWQVLKTMIDGEPISGHLLTFIESLENDAKQAVSNRSLYGINARTHSVILLKLTEIKEQAKQNGLLVLAPSTENSS